ncbi:hypothetical protein K2X33_12655 [bacterium]|nr:hypothetical protein [bacterium]
MARKFLFGMVLLAAAAQARAPEKESRLVSKRTSALMKEASELREKIEADPIARFLKNYLTNAGNKSDPDTLKIALRVYEKRTGRKVENGREHALAMYVEMSLLPDLIAGIERERGFLTYADLIRKGGAEGGAALGELIRTPWRGKAAENEDEYSFLRFRIDTEARQARAATGDKQKDLEAQYWDGIAAKRLYQAVELTEQYQANRSEGYPSSILPHNGEREFWNAFWQAGDLPAFQKLAKLPENPLELLAKALDETPKVAATLELRVMNHLEEYIAEPSYLESITRKKGAYLQKRMIRDFRALENLKMMDFEYSERMDILPGLDSVEQGIGSFLEKLPAGVLEEYRARILDE